LFDLRQVFSRYVNILTRIFEHNVSCPGLYGGLYGQNLPYTMCHARGWMVGCMGQNLPYKF
jgi:hypothetical protein